MYPKSEYGIQKTDGQVSGLKPWTFPPTLYSLFDKVLPGFHTPCYSAQSTIMIDDTNQLTPENLLDLETHSV